MRVKRHDRDEERRGRQEFLAKPLEWTSLALWLVIPLFLAAVVAAVVAFFH